mgnify:CR=1 FL=1
MNNPLYMAMNSGGMNLGSMLNQIKANPMQFLAQKRFNIPQNIANDPNAILQHLLSSGQVSQNQINAAFRMGRQMRGM